MIISLHIALGKLHLGTDNQEKGEITLKSHQGDKGAGAHAMITG